MIQITQNTYGNGVKKIGTAPNTLSLKANFLRFQPKTTQLVQIFGFDFSAVLE